MGNVTPKMLTSNWSWPCPLPQAAEEKVTFKPAQRQGPICEILGLKNTQGWMKHTELDNFSMGFQASRRSRYNTSSYRDRLKSLVLDDHFYFDFNFPSSYSYDLWEEPICWTCYPSCGCGSGKISQPCHVRCTAVAVRKHWCDRATSLLFRLRVSFPGINQS